MNDVRGWVEGKLKEEGYPSTRLPFLQLNIERTNFPNVRVMCIGLNEGDWFDAADVNAAIDRVPDIGFIVVVPSRITHAAYERAEERRICVTGFADLKAALKHHENIARYIDSQERYERRRLTHNKAVESLKRKGKHAYEVRRRGLRPLTIVTTNEYEFTVDELYSILESYEGVDLDAIVVTNPNFYGFSTDSKRAAAQAGIQIKYFEDFLADLGTHERE